MINRFFSTSLPTAPKAGFIILELCLALTIAGLLVMQILKVFLPLTNQWQIQQQRLFLDQAQQYIFAKLEYELAQNSLLVTISEDGKLLKSQTTSAMRQITFSKDYLNNKKGLYQTIKNAKGMSKNPIFLPEAELLDWKITKLNSQQLSITLQLSNARIQKDYTRVISLLNGKVEVE